MLVRQLCFTSQPARLVQDLVLVHMAMLRLLLDATPDTERQRQSDQLAVCLASHHHLFALVLLSLARAFYRWSDVTFAVGGGGDTC